MSSQGSIKNPFSTLAVRRDVEDMIAEEKPPQQEEVPLSIGGAKETKKKKIRPEERPRINMEQLANPEMKITQEEIEQGGFKEVRKVKRPERQIGGVWEPDEYLKKEYPKSIQKTHIYRPKGRNRIFDRHSGTGRGREISKGGAGSKTTWGSADQIAKENVIEYMAQKEGYLPTDEYCILLLN